jgi:hypothetical protein
MTKKWIASCCGHPIQNCPGCPEKTVLIAEDEYMQDVETVAKQIEIIWSDVQFTIDQLEKGIKVEMGEHHDDQQTRVIDTKEEAAKIAWSHLKEDPKYYDKLEKMEESTTLSSILLKIENKTVGIDDFNALISEATPASAIDRVRRKINPLNRSNRRKHDSSGHAKGLPKLAARINPSRKRSNRTQMQHGGRQGHRKSVRTQKRNAKLNEAITFFQTNIGKVINDDMTSCVDDIKFLKEIAIKLMSKPGINRDWLSDFVNKVSHV